MNVRFSKVSGLAEPIRLSFIVAGIPFKDRGLQTLVTFACTDFIHVVYVYIHIYIYTLRGCIHVCIYI